MSTVAGKLTQHEAHYGQGMQARHCGPTHQFSDGLNPIHTCSHFRETMTPHRVFCTRVYGNISATGWCKLWEAKKRS